MSAQLGYATAVSERGRASAPPLLHCAGGGANYVSNQNSLTVSQRPCHLSHLSATNEHLLGTSQAYDANTVSECGRASAPPPGSTSYRSYQNPVLLSIPGSPRPSHLSATYQRHLVGTSQVYNGRSKSTPPAVIQATSTDTSTVSELTMGVNGQKGLYVMPHDYLPTSLQKIDLNLAEKLYPTAHQIFKKEKPPFFKDLPSEARARAVELDRFRTQLLEFHHDVKLKIFGAFLTIRQLYIARCNVSITIQPDPAGPDKTKLFHLIDDIITFNEPIHLKGGTSKIPAIELFRDCDPNKGWIPIAIKKIEEEYDIRIALDSKKHSWVISVGTSVQDTIKKRIRKSAKKIHGVELRERKERRTRDLGNDNWGCDDVFSTEHHEDADTSLHSDISALTGMNGVALELNTSFGSGLSGIDSQDDLVSPASAASRSTDQPASFLNMSRNAAMTSDGSTKDARAGPDGLTSAEATNKAASSIDGETDERAEPERSPTRHTRSGKAGTLPIKPPKKKAHPRKMKKVDTPEEIDDSMLSDCESYTSCPSLPYSVLISFFNVAR